MSPITTKRKNSFVDYLIQERRELGFRNFAQEPEPHVRDSAVQLSSNTFMMSVVSQSSMRSSARENLSACLHYMKAQSPRWGTRRPLADPNSIFVLVAVIMEHPPPAEAATGTVSVPASRWRQLVVRMMYLFEAIRTRYFRLAERENRDKSILSDRRSFLVADAQKPASCLHPPPHIRRANQYATWTVCSKCGARQTYVSKRTPTAKSKARARAAAPTAPPDRTPDAMVGTFQPMTRSTTTTARSSRDPMPEPIHPELNATLQAMAASFQNVGETLRELTRGQSQMLTMMQQSAARGLDQLTVLEAQALARGDLQEMQVDATENGEWSPVTENPNADDLP